MEDDLYGRIMAMPRPATAPDVTIQPAIRAKRRRARFIRPAAWHEEFLAWLAAGLGPKAAAEEVGVHPTRPVQVSWVDEAFKARWVAINEMKEKADWDAIQARLAIIRARVR